MNKIEKIKAEIEFRIAQWSQYTFACASQIASEAIDRIDELKGLLAFIDSLHDETDMDLEKAIDKYESLVGGFESMSNHDCRQIARYFADWGCKWQKVKDSKISEEIDQNFTKSSDENFDAEVQKALDEMSEHMKTVEPEISFWDLLAKQYRHFVDWKEKQMLNSAVTGAVIGVGPLADSGPYDSKKSTRRSSATISVVNVPYCEISDIIKLIIIKP